MSGCFAPQTAPPSERLLPMTLGQSAAAWAMARTQTQYPLEPRPAAGPQAAAEAYLQRFQPGALPRVFATSHIYDRRGRLLADLFDEGRRTWVSLDQMSPQLLHAIVATEDGTFYENPGIDLRRLAGAVLQNLRSGDMVAGGSTITMQLARQLFMPPAERFSRSPDRKVSEIFLAQDLARLFTKDEILEMYLNLVYFGHRAYGPEAAAQTYFGKSALALDLAESSLLAGLPQAPAILDPFLNMDGARQRQRIVLNLMVRRGYITQAEADAAFAQPLALAPDPDLQTAQAPHFLAYLEDTLARPPYNINLRRAGLNVTTTLDLDMQEFAQQTVHDQVDAVRSRFNLNNAALVALKPGTAEILVMVGSADFADSAIGGQVNVTVRQRQPGSTIKPVVYAAALEQDELSPATLLWDSSVRYPIAGSQDYEPVNYDGKFRGPVTVRTALANSLNVPAVKVFDGLDPARFLATAQAMGIHSYSQEIIDRFGLAAGLGGAEVTPLELATAYHTIANQGRYVPPTPLLRLADGRGRPMALPAAAPVQAIAPATAFLLTDILSDNAARSPIFGEDSQLKISAPAAAKTGTTTDFRDNWTMGFTRYLVAGVWAGNNDGAPMQNASGITGAAPIWNKFMEGVLADANLRSVLAAPADPAAWAFAPPPDVVQVDMPCPAALRCRDGGEYFPRRWVAQQGAPGAYADSFLVGVMAPVTAAYKDGRQAKAGICLREPAAPDDPRAATALVLPQGLGVHSVVAQNSTGPLAALAALAADGSGFSDLLDRLARLASASAMPSSQAVTPTAQLRDDLAAARRWAAGSGQLVALGACAQAEAVVRAFYGGDIAMVTIGDALAPDQLAAYIPADDGSGQAAGGPNGIAAPHAGATVSGEVAVRGAASNPNFWKWQLDLLIDGRQDTFLALGEWQANSISELFRWNTRAYPNGSHMLRLRVVHRDGNYDEYYTPVRVDNG